MITELCFYLPSVLFLQFTTLFTGRSFFGWCKFYHFNVLFFSSVTLILFAILTNSIIIFLGSFLIVNAVVIWLCHRTTKKEKLVYHMALVVSFFLAAFSTHAMLAWLNAKQNRGSEYNSIVQLCGLLFFSLFFSFTAYCAGWVWRVAGKRSRGMAELFPVAVQIVEITLFAVFCRCFFSLQMEENAQYMVTIIAISFVITQLFFIGAILFFLDEKMFSLFQERQTIAIIRERTKNSDAYYADLQEQQEKSALLIHDIKGYLYTIKGLAQKEKSKEIMEFVDSVLLNRGLIPTKNYSCSPVINIIVSRYEALCNKNDIDFDANIKSTDYEVFGSSELTSVLDNLLQNAVTAAQQTKKPFVRLFVSPVNENYISFRTVNSVSHDTNCENLISKREYGYGLKNINRIAKKYDGEMTFEYDKENHFFTVAVLMKRTSV